VPRGTLLAKLNTSRWRTDSKGVSRWCPSRARTKMSSMGDLSKRFYGECLNEGQEPTLEVGAFVERLLVFDSVVLRSARLAEVEGLVEVFGPRATSRLIESGDVA